MSEEPIYRLNRNAGVDTLHVEHPWEECNVDDADGVETVDEMTAEAMLVRGDAVPCQHCQPLQGLPG
jgi:hypothetical protein